MKATRETDEASRKLVIVEKLATVCEEDKLSIEETPAFTAPLLLFALALEAG